MRFACRLGHFYASVAAATACDLEHDAPIPIPAQGPRPRRGLEARIRHALRRRA